MSKIGSNIRKIRSVKALSQSGFAQIFKLTRASIGAYEEGRAEPKIDTVIEIAKYFSISLGDIFTKDLTVNQLTNFLLIEKLNTNTPLTNSENHLNLDFISSNMLSNKKDLIKQLVNKNKFNKISFPNIPKGADIFFLLGDLYILGLQHKNVHAIICESTNTPIKNSLILAVSKNEIVYGKIMDNSTEIKLSDTGEEKTLDGKQYFFHVKLIISAPFESTSSFQDKLVDIENRIKALEENH